LCGVKLGVFHDSEFNANTYFALKPLLMTTPISSALRKLILNFVLVTNIALQYSGAVEMVIYGL